ncbi:unnamed protein product, partial [Ixodes persulcatus]
MPCADDVGGDGGSAISGTPAHAPRRGLAIRHAPRSRSGPTDTRMPLAAHHRRHMEPLALQRSAARQLLARRANAAPASARRSLGGRGEPPRRPIGPALGHWESATGGLAASANGTT